MAKKMTKSERADKLREMADSIAVRNHISAMLNQGRVLKEKRKDILKFLDYIDNEIVNVSLSIMPSEVEPIKNSNSADMVAARLKQQEEKEKMAEQTRKLKEKEEKEDKALFKRVKTETVE